MVERVYVVLGLVEERTLNCRVVTIVAVVAHALFDVLKLVVEVGRHECEYFAERVEESFKVNELKQK